MSARSRSRARYNQDADEECRLWKEIKDKAHDVVVMIARSNEICYEILQTETQQAALIDASKPFDASLDKKLEELYRENLKLCEEVQHIIAGASSEMNVLDSINILAGLREASSAERAFATAVPLGQRHRTASRKLAYERLNKPGTRGSISAAVTEDDGDDISTAALPLTSLSQTSRFSTKDKPSHECLVPVARGTSVGSIANTESALSTSGIGKAESLPPSACLSTCVTFSAGEMVFYRHEDKLLEGEGILCRITAVIGESKQRRYEIQDMEFNCFTNTSAGERKAPAVANTSTSGSSSSFRASTASLMQIPASNERLPDLPKGTLVSALYPQTTTFYRGQVSASWRIKHNIGHVRVTFEGEMDNIESQVVERRFVLLER